MRASLVRSQATHDEVDKEISPPRPTRGLRAAHFAPFTDHRDLTVIRRTYARLALNIARLLKCTVHVAFH